MVPKQPGSLVMVLASPIEMENLKLDTLREENADVRYESWMRDPVVIQYLESRFEPPTQKSIAAFITRMNESEGSLLLGMFMHHEHIGNIKLGPINPHHLRGPIGLMIGQRDQWGKGYATQAIRALTRHAFQTLGLHKVYAGCYEDNIGSIRAFLKAGWREEARLARNSYCGDTWRDDVLLASINPMCSD